jgi:alpha-tubulin suppressor-like RCC1 family protein
VAKSLPVAVTTLVGVVAIAAGESHSLALKSDGTVWAWGWNAYGQLGDGTTSLRTSPVPTTSLSNVVALAAGSRHNVALKSDGTVWTWGWNAFGQLGDGTADTSMVPIQVTGIPSRVVAVAARGSRTYAVDVLGTAWEFGGDTSVPTQLDLPSPVTMAVGAPGGWFALTGSGDVWAWGTNDRGQLGDGTTDDKSEPEILSTISSVTQTSAGSWHTLALRTNGTVWAWGGNEFRQLGDGMPLCPPNTGNCPALQFSPTPAAVNGPDDVIAVSAGGSSSLAVSSDGRVWAWVPAWRRHDCRPRVGCADLRRRIRMAYRHTDSHIRRHVPCRAVGDRCVRDPRRDDSLHAERRGPN